MRVLLALITVGITIYGFVDCFRCTDAEVRNLPRPLWLLVTLIPLVGGLAWLTFGRPLGEQTVRHTTRTIAPDDDPEFLQSLERTFRERRRVAAEEARRRRRAEEAERRAAEEAQNRESRRGGRSAGRGGNGKSGNGKSGNGKSGGDESGGTPGDGDQHPDSATPSPSAGPDGDDRQSPA
jgi:uncharacterized membrane protein YgcG